MRVLFRGGRFADEPFCPELEFVGLPLFLIVGVEIDDGVETAAGAGVGVVWAMSMGCCTSVAIFGPIRWPTRTVLGVRRRVRGR